MRQVLLLAAICAVSLFAQKDSAELRLQVLDPAGNSLQAAVELVNQATQTHQSIELPADGRYIFKNLPFGAYRLRIAHPGFTPSSEMVELRSRVPVTRTVTLGVEPLQATIDVTESDTLLDLAQTGSAHYIGAEQIKGRPVGLAGRGVVDLVTMQPGWTLEANGVLH